MRQALVYHNHRLAGFLSERSPREYEFRYDDAYYADRDAPAISLTLLKTQQVYRDSCLFPFFANMISEGHNRTVQARMHHLDEEDDFGILPATAHTFTIHRHSFAI